MFVTENILDIDNIILLGAMALEGYKNDTPEFPTQSLLVKKKTLGGFFDFSFFQNNRKVHIKQLFPYSVMSYIIFCERKIKKKVKENSRQVIYSSRFPRIENYYISQS